jgi:hypothetical protein
MLDAFNNAGWSVSIGAGSFQSVFAMAPAA